MLGGAVGCMVGVPARDVPVCSLVRECPSVSLVDEDVVAGLEPWIVAASTNIRIEHSFLVLS
mgnify:FL=1